MTPRQIESLRTIFKHRCTSMLEDGYVEVSYTDMTYFIFAKLRHRTNGNIVTLTAFPQSNRMMQKTNGRVVYDGPIQG